MFEIPIKSAERPMAIEPMAPIPKASPTVSPAIVPIFPGTSSCAYTTVTEKLDMSVKPANKSRQKAAAGGTNGIRMVNGAEIIIDRRIISFFPNRSAKGPPKNVPRAPATKNVNKKI